MRNLKRGDQEPLQITVNVLVNERAWMQWRTFLYQIILRNEDNLCNCFENEETLECYS